MGKVIDFPILAIGEIIKIDLEGETVKCEVLRHEGNSVYKIKALNGQYKGRVGHFHITNVGAKRIK